MQDRGMNKRADGDVGLGVIVAVVIVAALIYVFAFGGTASGKTLKNGTEGVSDAVFSIISGVVVGNVPCTDAGGLVCTQNNMVCQNYCTAEKSASGGYCSNAQTSCVEPVPCCCVCT